MMIFQEFAMTLNPVFANGWWRLALIVAIALAVALILQVLVLPLLHRLTRRSRTDLDDHIFARLRPPLLQTVFLEAIHWAVVDYVPDPQIDTVVHRVVVTLLVLIWGRAILDVGTIVFRKLSENVERFNWIQPQTLPLVQFGFKVLVISAQAWMIMSVWHISLTSWLASAGVVGIAVGFAAKDTLANFISGIFILADAPYKVGQYIIIDGDTRGVVTEIGMRSTRLLTRDNVEVTVPNAVIGNAKIVNESSGPSPLMRVRIPVGVAYGCDIDRVSALLEECVVDVPHVSDQQPTAVRFMAMGESSLNFEIRTWASHPVFRGRIVDEINTRVYKALVAEGIQIPFPQRDLHIKSWPGPPPAD
jgi:small-conductance mechanosensitive channel